MAFKPILSIAGVLPLLLATPAVAEKNNNPAPTAATEAAPAPAATPAPRKTVQIPPAPVRTQQQNENYQRGEQIARELGYFDVLPLEPEKQGPNGGFTQFTLETLMPNVYGRPGLSLRERELIVMSIIITQGNPQGLMWHFREVAPRLRISEHELREMMYISCIYAGWPKCSYAINELGKVVMGPNKWPKELLMEPPKDAPTLTPKP